MRSACSNRLGRPCAGVSGYSANIACRPDTTAEDRKSTRLNSSHGYISYAVFCLKKKKTYNAPLSIAKPGTRYFGLLSCVTLILSGCISDPTGHSWWGFGTALIAWCESEESHVQS